MRELSLEELELDVDAVVDAAERGETITIVRDGTPIARMEPIVPSSDDAS